MVVLVPHAMAVVVAMMMVVVAMVAARLAAGAGDVEHVMGVLVMMVMVVAAAAIGAMGVGVMAMVMAVVVMPVIVLVLVRVSVVIVPMMAVTMPVIMGVAAGIGALFGPEGAAHLRDRAALAADHLGEDMIVADEDGVLGDLGGGVAVADMPGDAGEPERVLGADLEQRLLAGADGDQAAILEPEGVALVQHRRLLEVDHEFEPARALQHRPAALPLLMVECHGVDDAVGLHGRLPDDRCGAQHGFGILLMLAGI